MLPLYRDFIESNSMLFVFNFSPLPDSGGTKGERLNARLKAFPETREPYESSVCKEIGKWASYTFLLYWPLKMGKWKK